jgi:hypothetical protein
MKYSTGSIGYSVVDVYNCLSSLLVSELAKYPELFSLSTGSINIDDLDVPCLTLTLSGKNHDGGSAQEVHFYCETRLEWDEINGGYHLRGDNDFSAIMYYDEDSGIGDPVVSALKDPASFLLDAGHLCEVLGFQLPEVSDLNERLMKQLISVLWCSRNQGAHWSELLPV